MQISLKPICSIALFILPHKPLVSSKLISITCVNYTSKPINSSFLIRFSLLKPEIAKETKVNWGNYMKTSVYAKLPHAEKNDNNKRKLGLFTGIGNNNNFQGHQHIY